LRADWQKIGAIAGKARDRALRFMAWRGRFPTRFRHSALNREPRQTAVAHRVKAQPIRRQWPRQASTSTN